MKYIKWQSTFIFEHNMLHYKYKLCIKSLIKIYINCKMDKYKSKTIHYACKTVTLAYYI